MKKLTKEEEILAELGDELLNNIKNTKSALEKLDNFIKCITEYEDDFVTKYEKTIKRLRNKTNKKLSELREQNERRKHKK